jgi:type II secretory pathway pseudopilin PulG
LVEVLIALFILSLAVFTVGGMFPSANRVVLRSQETEVATMLARQKLEEIRQQSYDDLPIAGTAAPYEIWVPFTPAGGLPNAWGWIHYGRVDPAMDWTTEETGRCLVRVWVNWYGAGAYAHLRQVYLTSLVTKE